MFGLLRYGRDQRWAGVIEALFDWLPTLLPILIALNLGTGHQVAALVTTLVLMAVWLGYVVGYERHHRHAWGHECETGAAGSLFCSALPTQ